MRIAGQPGIRIQSAGEGFRGALVSLPEPAPVAWNRPTWLALASLVCLWACLFAATWGHWGDLTIDCGREMYVPAALSHGKTLYTGIWYPYTPGAPYLNSILFRIFGIHLAVLYWAGSLSALGSAALLYITGLHVTSRIAAWTTGAILLVEAFVCSEFCFPLPYSFGAVYGCVAACLCLWCAVNACSNQRWQWMFGAGMAAAAAFLVKQEIGVGCFAALAILIGARGLQQRPNGHSTRQITRDLTTLLPCALLCLAVVGWMISLRGVHFLTQENLMSWPTSYFMKKYGAMWLGVTGLSFSKISLLKILALGATVGIWCFLRWLLAADDRGQVFSLLLLCLGALVILANSSEIALHALDLFIPRAALFLIALTIPVSAWLCWNRRLAGGSLKLVMLFSMAVLIAPRTLFETLPKGYSIFYNGPILLSMFVIMSWVVFPKRAWKTPGVRPAYVIPYLAIVLALLVDVEPLYLHAYTPVPLMTSRGVIYAAPDKVRAYQSALDFINRKKNEGAGILSIPEDMSLYFLGGIECPTRVCAFTPGLLAPGKMIEDTIAEIERAKVRYLIWSNRTFPEYGVPVFGMDFDQPLGLYLGAHYRPLDRIENPIGWNAVIWERIADPSHR